MLVVTSLTVMVIIFYQLFHFANDKNNDDFKSLINHHRTNLEHFDLLNDTLSALKAELQLIYKYKKEKRIPLALNDLLSTNLTAFAPVLDSTTIMNEDMKINDKILLHNNEIHEKGIERLQKKGLLFTMDSISSYETASKNGGAAGELLIRHSLENVFKELNVILDVKTSDEGTFMYVNKYRYEKLQLNT